MRERADERYIIEICDKTLKNNMQTWHELFYKIILIIVIITIFIISNTVTVSVTDEPLYIDGIDIFSDTSKIKTNLLVPKPSNPLTY